MARTKQTARRSEPGSRWRLASPRDPEEQKVYQMYAGVSAANEGTELSINELTELMDKQRKRQSELEAWYEALRKRNLN